MTAVKMLDVSANNHTNELQLPWGALYSQGYRAVMIKATEGESYVNPYLKADSEGALDAHFEVGYYHFAQPKVGNAPDEVNHLWQTVKNLPRDIGLALDLEVQNGMTWAQLGTWADRFLAAIPTEVKNRVLYTNPNYADNMPKLAAEHPLWFASWGVQPRRKVWAWQMGQAQVAGMPSLTDVGVLYG